MLQTTDRALLTRIANGEALALRELYARHADRIYNTAISYVQNPVDAEEVTQDVFTKVWRSAENFKAESQVTTWVYRITVNTALTALKKRQRYGFLGALTASHDPPDFHHPNAVLEERELNQALFANIYRLPDRQKTAFILSYVEELPRAQVAEVMGITLKATESLLMRAKSGLRTALKNDYPHRGKTKRKRS